MTERIPQSTTKLVLFKAYLSSDHVTEATGKTIAITISKNGGAFGNPNAGATNATEISSGWYKVSLDTTDTGTLGPLAVRGAVATIDDVGILIEVVSATSGGYTNLDAAVTSRMATYTQPTGFLAATFPTGTVANTTNITAGTITTVSTVTGLTASNLDTTVSSRLASGSYTAPDNASITGIKSKTDSLSFTVANRVDSNIRNVNSIAVTGSGTLGTPWGP